MNIDIKKLLESIIKYSHSLEGIRKEHIVAALKDQGLEVINSKIVEPEWYVTIKDYGRLLGHDGYIPIFMKGEKTTKEKILLNCRGITSDEFIEHFHPLTPPTEKDPCEGCTLSNCGTCEHSEHAEVERIKEAMYGRATSDGELTEFEKSVRDIITSELCNNFGDVSFGVSISDEEAKLIAKKILPIARREIIKSIDTEAMVEVIKKTIEDNPLGIMASLSIPGAYRMGMEDAKNIIATKG